MDFYNRLRGGAFSRTSMLNYESHYNHFLKLAKEGAKDVLHFTISSGLSPTVTVAQKAAADIKKDYPDFNLLAVDSLSATIGQGALVRAALGTGRRLAALGFLLLTVGLVLGAAWGKVCWGHWWQFDPKEMWSLATWFVYAAYFHLRPRLSPRAERACLVAGAVMILLTLTWINLSRFFTGMHSYA